MHEACRWRAGGVIWKLQRTGQTDAKTFESGYAKANLGAVEWRRWSYPCWRPPRAASPAITFVNYSIGRGCALVCLAEADPSSNCVVQGANSGAFVTADNTGLAGTGLTAQLWVGPEAGRQRFCPWGARPFAPARTPVCFRRSLPIPVTFALAGQRINYQLRVWENRGGTINSWDRSDQQSVRIARRRASLPLAAAQRRARTPWSSSIVSCWSPISPPPGPRALHEPGWLHAAHRLLSRHPNARCA